MPNYEDPRNEKLLEVIADLQKEHTRWETRLKECHSLISMTKDTESPIYKEAQRMCVILDARVDFIELLIHRYRGWRL